MAFPSLLLAIIIVARLGPELRNAVVALGIVGVPAFYRLTRGCTISARKATYVEAARAVGASDRRILLRHILPNSASSLVVLTTMRVGVLVLAGGGLSFIGLGAQPPHPEWGALLASGRDYMDTAPWLAIFPGLCITLTVMGFNLLGDGLRDALDPRRPTGH
jgi:ABC-type dipeptide/oligopeptide/nickel transport system permease subunit